MRVKTAALRRCRRNYDEDLPIGYSAVDSVHSPVRRSTIVEAPVSQMTDYEKLMIESGPNGAITPQTPSASAAKL